MDIALFEAALAGLATKDDDEPARSEQQASTKLSPDSAIVADVKPEEPVVKKEEEDEHEDIIASALLNAGITPSSSNHATNNNHGGLSTPAPLVKVINGTGSKVVRIATTNQGRVAASPRMASQLIQISGAPGGVAKIAQPQHFPNIIRKRPNTEDAVLPPVKFFRRNDLTNRNQVKIEPPELKFRPQPLNHQRFPNFPFNYLTRVCRLLLHAFSLFLLIYQMKQRSPSAVCRQIYFLLF